MIGVELDFPSFTVRLASYQRNTDASSNIVSQRPSVGVISDVIFHGDLKQAPKPAIEPPTRKKVLSEHLYMWRLDSFQV